MKKHFFIIVLLLYTGIVSANFDWKTYKTERFTLFYKPGFEKKALRLLEGLEYYAPIGEKITGAKKAGIPVVLEDFGQLPTYGGMANPVFYKISLNGREYDDADMGAKIGLHEHVHILHLTKSSGIPGFLGMLFGDVMNPGLFSPGWLIEGITTLSEHRASPYTGRMHTGYFDSYIGSCVSENRLPDIMDATYTPQEAPSYMGYYLFGGEFLRYLADKYGEEKFSKFFDSYGSSVLSYFSPVIPFAGIDRTFDELFGKITTDLWDEWLESEKEKYKDYRQEGINITEHGWYAFTPVIHGNRLYYLKSVSEKKGPFMERAYNEIVSIDLEVKVPETEAKTTSSFNMPPRFSGNNMYYSVIEKKPGYGNKNSATYGGFSVIYEKNLDSGSVRELFCAEIRAFFTDEERIIYAVDDIENYGSEIRSYDIGKGTDSLLFRTKELILGMDGKNGNNYASAKKENTNPDIYRLDLKNRKLKRITKTPFQEKNVSVCGSKVFFDADYSGMHAVYCYDTDKKLFYRYTKNGSAEAPAYFERANEIYFTGMGTAGFDIFYEKADPEKYRLPEQDYKEPEFDGTGIKDLKEGGFADALPGLIPKLRSPIAYFDTDENKTSAAGIMLYGIDFLETFTYNLQLFYHGQKDKAVTAVDAGTTLLAPLNIYGGYSNVEEEQAYSGISYPVFSGLRNGIKGIRAGITYRLFDDFYRDEFIPGVNVYMGWPDTDTGAGVSAALEPSYNYDSFTRLGWFSSAFIRHYFQIGNFFTGIKYFNDPDNNDDVMPVLRGYADPLNGKTGTALTAEYTIPLFELRRGFWNPNIYFEDIFLKFFTDSAFTSLDTQFSYGAELIFEVKAGFSYLPFGITLFAVGNKDGEKTIGVKAGY